MLVYRYRVMKTLNDPKRNPNKESTLYFSSNNEERAHDVAALENNNGFGDIFQVVDGGQEEHIDDVESFLF